MGRNLKFILIIVIVIIVVIFAVVGIYYYLLNSIQPELKFTHNTVDDQPHPNFVKDGLEDGAVFIFFTQNDENCPPCARMRPKVEELINEFNDDVVFYIININEDTITTIFKDNDKTEAISDTEIEEAYYVYDKENIAAGRVATPTFVIITLDTYDGEVKPSFAVGYGEFEEEDAQKTKNILTNDLAYAIFNYEKNK